MDILWNDIKPNGKLHEIDISPKLIDFLKDRREKLVTMTLVILYLHLKGLDASDVIVTLGEETKVNLPENSVDLVFLCDAYHHIEYPQAFLEVGISLLFLICAVHS